MNGSDDKEGGKEGGRGGSQTAGVTEGETSDGCNVLETGTKMRKWEN